MCGKYTVYGNDSVCVCVCVYVIWYCRASLPFDMLTTLLP